MTRALHQALRWLFFALVVRPLTLFALGLNVRGRERLPASGPAIIIANHNSHLDAPVIMSLFPLRLLPQLRPVAAADYFLSTGCRGWFSLNLMGVIPINRQVQGAHDDPLAPLCAALDSGQVLILFPEGSRGEPEQLDQFRQGVAHLARRRPDVPIVPLFLHGLGKALPRGEALLVPMICDIFVGEAIFWSGDRHQLMQQANDTMHRLREAGGFADWV